MLHASLRVWHGNTRVWTRQQSDLLPVTILLVCQTECEILYLKRLAMLNDYTSRYTCIYNDTMMEDTGGIG